MFPQVSYLVKHLTARISSPVFLMPVSLWLISSDCRKIKLLAARLMLLTLEMHGINGMRMNLSHMTIFRRTSDLSLDLVLQYCMIYEASLWIKLCVEAFCLFCVCCCSCALLFPHCSFLTFGVLAHWIVVQQVRFVPFFPGTYCRLRYIWIHFSFLRWRSGDYGVVLGIKLIGVAEGLLTRTRM